MDAATITALSAGIVGIIGAVASLVAVLRHVTNPAAHAVAIAKESGYEQEDGQGSSAGRV